MPSASALVLFLGAAFLVLVVPGPAVLYIVARSAAEGTRAGLASVAGIHVGTAVHVAAAVGGLSAIVVASATAFTVVKLAGAAYLVVLGVRAMLGRGGSIGDGDDPAVAVVPRSLRRSFVDGAVVNVLNPKVAVFFLAFVPQFVDSGRGDAPTQVLVLGGAFIALGMLTDGAYALGGAWLGARLRRSPRLRRRSQVVAGTAYLGIAAATVASGDVRPALAARP